MKPLSADLHQLLIRPRNQSLVLGAAHHLLYRPADAAARAVTGHGVPRALDPDAWGAAAAHLGESADFALAPKGSTRSEAITLENQHLRDLGDHVDWMKQHNRDFGDRLETGLNSVVRDHYNKTENFRSLVQQARENEQFAATLHGVTVPSLTGEVGRFAKNVASDAAAMYGASEIVNQLHRAAQPDTKEKRSHAMSNLSKAAELLEKAASILESIPLKDLAHKQASQLLEAGVITEGEVEKYASAFERNPDDAPTILEGMLRGSDNEAKMANLGDPVYEDAPRPSRYGAFEQACLQGLR